MHEIVFESDVFTTTGKCQEHSGERWRLGRSCRKKDMAYDFHWEGHVFLFTTHQHWHLPFSSKALESQCLSKLTSSFVSPTCMASHPEVFVCLFFSVLRLSRVRNHLLASWEFSWRCPVAISHVFLQAFYWGTARKTLRSIVQCSSIDILIPPSNPKMWQYLLVLCSFGYFFLSFNLI